MSPTEYQSEQEQMLPIEYQSEPGTDVANRISKWVGEWWGNSEMFENFPQVLQWWESWTCRSLVPHGFAKPTVRRGLVQWYPSMDSGSHPLSTQKPTGEVGSGCHAVARESGREKKRKVWPFLNTCRGNLRVFSSFSPFTSFPSVFMIPSLLPYVILTSYVKDKRPTLWLQIQMIHMPGVGRIMVQCVTHLNRPVLTLKI